MMKRFLLLLILCVAFAVLKAAAIALAALVATMLLFGFITRPQQTVVFLCALALPTLAVAQPLACIVTLGVVGVVIVLTGRNRNRSSARHLDSPPP